MPQQTETLSIINKETGLVLAQEARLAHTFWRRLRGLLGEKKLERGREGLVLTPCSAVHTFGMLFPLDLLFVSGAGEVLQAIPSFPQGRFSPCVRGARYVVELPAGMIAATGTKEGQRLHMDGLTQLL